MCLSLHDAKNAMVRSAADMTVRQIISLLFDRVAEELGATEDTRSGAKSGAESDDYGGNGEAGLGGGGEAEGARGDEGALRCAHLVFQVCREFAQEDEQLSLSNK